MTDQESLTGVMSSLLRYYGAETSHKTLPLLDGRLAACPRNVVLLLFDGMGDEVVRGHLPEDSFLRRHMAAVIGTVFPPTTAAAITTVDSGLSPAEHGWLGWSLRFGALGGKIVEVFTNRSDGAPAADYNVAGRFLGYRSLCERIHEASPDVTALRISPFSGDTLPDGRSVRSGGIPELCRMICEICAAPGRHYIYGYDPQPDYDMHDLGTGHERVREHLRMIDSEVKRLAEGLDDTLIIVTADHGLTDTTFRYMSEELKGMLVCPPSVEGRAMSLFVRHGKAEEFCELFDAENGDIYTLIPHDEVMSSHIFGGGVPHPLTESFIGDFLAVAKTNVSLGYEYDPSPFRAAHAGLTPEETRIPLILIN